MVVADAPTHHHRRDSARMIGRAKELRAEMTRAEVVLWDKLRDRRLGGLKFRRQHPVGRYVADFYCAKARLIVELDGKSHDDRADQDNQREAQLRSRGLLVLRFTNDDVLWRIESVKATILARAHRL